MSRLSGKAAKAHQSRSGPCLDHGSVSVLLHIAHNLDGYIGPMFPIPAFKDAPKGPCSDNTVGFQLSLQ